ncbi:hypothetical protein [Polyangium fumosum]|uniref:Uncharacterized protein n=1 Tax=Polyangium fumosum TaxID=889272 RepID=A0A4U1IQC3_9BACT|nr:hypothetical protein [Polyangium fumosum]TKC96339.1 hypothetical protein E8A74_45875 [Polyangium fumosum]
MQAKPIHHLNLSLRACLARITLNGFQLDAVDARAPISLAPPINQLLVGKGNVLGIQALPTITREGMSSPLDIDITGSVSAYQEGDFVAPDAPGDVVLTIDVKSALAGQVPAIPLQLSFEFDNDGPAFPALFREAAPIEEPEPLLAYAAHLRDLFAAKDVAGIVKEFSPKLRDYGIAYDETEARMRDEFVEFVQSRLFPGPMDLKFEASHILPVSMCEGRIWELQRKPLRPLLQTLPDKDGGQFQIPVYVARVDGALRVVR